MEAPSSVQVEAMPNFQPEVADFTGNLVLPPVSYEPDPEFPERLRERTVHLVEHFEAEERRLARPVATHFGEAIAALKFVRMFGKSIEELHREVYVFDRGNDAIDWETEALSDLVMTGHLVSGEVILLLEAGFAAGAEARCRALLELVLRARLIRVGGADTARLFSEHEAWRHHKGEPSQELVTQLGDVLKGEYGWAHPIMLEIDQDYRDRFGGKRRRRGPVLSDIFRAVGAFHSLGYDRASSAVHGSKWSVLTDEEASPFAVVRSGPSPISVPQAGERLLDSLASLYYAFIGRDRSDPRMQRLCWYFAIMVDKAVDEWEIVAEEGREQLARSEAK